VSRSRPFNQSSCRRNSRISGSLGDGGSDGNTSSAAPATLPLPSSLMATMYRLRFKRPWTVPIVSLFKVTYKSTIHVSRTENLGRLGKARTANLSQSRAIGHAFMFVRAMIGRSGWPPGTLTRTVSYSSTRVLHRNRPQRRP
jgi:hypothetical protein